MWEQLEYANKRQYIKKAQCSETKVSGNKLPIFFSYLRNTVISTWMESIRHMPLHKILTK